MREQKAHSDGVSGAKPGASLSMWNSKLLARLLRACVLQMLMCCFLHARRLPTTEPPINHKIASISPLVCWFLASSLPSAGFLDCEWHGWDSQQAWRSCVVRMDIPDAPRTQPSEWVRWITTAHWTSYLQLHGSILINKVLLQQQSFDKLWNAIRARCSWV